MHRTFPALPAMIVLLLLVVSSPVGAQRSGAMRMLAEKEKETAVEIQVGSVARILDLDDSQASKLKEAYTRSRNNFLKAVTDKISEVKDDNSLLMNTVYQIQMIERDKLGTSVSGFLNDDEVKKIKETLGSFNQHWDTLAVELSKLDLESGPRAKAETRLLEYVVEVSPSRDEGYQNGDLAFVLRSMVAGKDRLDADLKKIMPKEAFAKWEEATRLKFERPGS
jgi:hypothetical protein